MKPLDRDTAKKLFDHYKPKQIFKTKFGPET